MKRLLLIGIVMTLSARAQWIVEDPALVQIATQHSLKLEQLTAGLARLNLLVGQIDRNQGMATTSVLSRERDGTFITNVGKMGAPENRIDRITDKADVRGALRRVTNPFRSFVAAKGARKEDPREPRRYDYNLRTENAVRFLREQAEVNRKHQHEFMLRLAGANQEFERSRTHADLQAAMADIFRITAMMNSAEFVSRNLERDLGYREKLKTLAIQEKTMLRNERDLGRGKKTGEKRSVVQQDESRRAESLRGSSPLPAWDLARLLNRKANEDIK